MGIGMTGPAKPTHLYLSAEHPCAYLPERTARLAFVDPDAGMDASTYGWYAEHGFRRSGTSVYRPYCSRCQACVPVRIPVADFVPDRGQRRIWNRNGDLSVQVVATDFSAEHYALYKRYLAARHPGSSMEEANESDYHQFLLSSWGRTRLMEMRAAGVLVAVAVVDELPQAWSAVYTFFEPELAKRSLGTYAVLRQIDAVRRLDLRWLYLGYWIAASRKMAYKDRFRPYEQLGVNGWQRNA